MGWYFAGVVGCVAFACGEEVVDADAPETSASSDDTSMQLVTGHDFDAWVRRYVDLLPR